MNTRAFLKYHALLLELRTAWAYMSHKKPQQLLQVRVQAVIIKSKRIAIARKPNVLNFTVTASLQASCVALNAIAMDATIIQSAKNEPMLYSALSIDNPMLSDQRYRVIVIRKAVTAHDLDV